MKLAEFIEALEKAGSKYMSRLRILAKTENAIDMLAEKITKEQIISARFEESGDNDPIQPTENFSISPGYF